MALKLILVFVVLLGLICLGLSYPLHASCSVEWHFAMTCGDVENRIVNQILKWKGTSGCASGGEKCNYELVMQDKTNVKAKHATPVKHYIDVLTFTFNNSGKCIVVGTSRSETWYAHFAYGTNYCNLHNLIKGSGLVNVAGYKEVTNDSVCTRYSSANCAKY